MKILTRKAVSLVLVFILCFSVFVGANAPVKAATVDYVYSGSYIKNWGTREELATFMSPNAELFYEDNNTSYEELAKLSGSSSTSSVPSSALYKELQTLMRSNHSKITSYNATRDLFQYTDCQNSGKTSNKISSFYSGDLIGPSWDSGATWNREHTWPNSKGDQAGDGENDIMMLRPTAKSENGSRGNKAYGVSSTFYNPNSESGGEHDLRGDVVRILLYQYVRWGCTNLMWGSSGVIESKDVLIDWLEADPVDTWELGRNDSVESITGTRNVFVDYPELAFVLFGEEVPDNYSSPYGGAAEVTPGEPEEPTEVIKVVENPVINTPYKFGMIQGNVSSTDVYYIKGGMASTYYLDTANDFDSALDVYLEATSGGYYLYAMIDGAKNYINMVVSGTHVNNVYQSTPSTVYTFNTTSKTVVSTVNDEEYRIGTRNDKSYTTVGPVKSSANGFYCQFYAKFVEEQVPDESVEPGSTGDLTSDGVINNKDLGLFMQHLNGWQVTIVLSAADINADGKVNNKDYGLLMQYLNGWDIDFGGSSNDDNSSENETTNSNDGPLVYF